MDAIKSCNQCWASYTRETWAALQLIICGEETERNHEHRRCTCGQVLTVERAWLLHDDAPEPSEEIDDPTELFLLPDGNVLLLWPVGDGSYSARKIPGAVLRRAHEQAAAIEGT